MRENLESDGDRMITTVDMPQDSQWDLWKMGSLIVFQCALERSSSRFRLCGDRMDAAPVSSHDGR